MKTIDVKKYVCEVCGAKHDSEAGCLACEESHKASRVVLSVDVCSGGAVVKVTDVKNAKTAPFKVSRRTYIAKMSPKKVNLEWECYVPRDKVEEGRNCVIDASQKWFFANASNTLALAVKKDAAPVTPDAQRRRPGRPRKNH